MGFKFRDEQPVTPTIVEENLAQPVVNEEQLKEYALQFVEEQQLLVKFYIWVEIQEQLKQVNLDIDK